MPFNAFVGDQQMTALKNVLNVNGVLTALNIPLTVKDDKGVDTGVPNNYGVMIQDPYYLMPNYLPQLIISPQQEQATDEQFSVVTTTTSYYVYYAMTFADNLLYVQPMYQALRKVVQTLLAVRLGQTYWYDMSMPTIQVNNEVSRWYAENQIRIAAGRVMFDLYHKDFWV